MIEFLLAKCSFSQQSVTENHTQNHNHYHNHYQPQQFCLTQILQKNPNSHSRHDDDKSFVDKLETSRISGNVSEKESWGKGENIICEDEDETYYTTNSSWGRKENELKFGCCQKSMNGVIRRIENWGGQEVRDALNKIIMK